MSWVTTSARPTHMRTTLCLMVVVRVPLTAASPLRRQERSCRTATCAAVDSRTFDSNCIQATLRRWRITSRRSPVTTRERICLQQRSMIRRRGLQPLGFRSMSSRTTPLQIATRSRSRVSTQLLHKARASCVRLRPGRKVAMNLCTRTRIQTSAAQIPSPTWLRDSTDRARQRQCR